MPKGGKRPGAGRPKGSKNKHKARVDEIMHMALQSAAVAGKKWTPLGLAPYGCRFLTRRRRGCPSICWSQSRR